MFARSIKKSVLSTHGALSADPKASNYRMTDYGYGKEGVRILARTKEGSKHVIKEFEVVVHLKLATHKEYYNGENADMVGSDVQENLVYVLAKKHGIKSPEEFAFLMSSYLLDTYPQVQEAHLHVEEAPWQRFGESESKETGGSYPDQMHDHAFIMAPLSYRFCDVLRRRGEQHPTVMCGIRGLRILKTAQAPFVNYSADPFRVQKDLPHRILCAVVSGQWEYSNSDTSEIDFTADWYKIKDIILKKFAGPPVEGTTLTSVQYCSYQTEKEILDQLQRLCSVSLQYQNKLYVDYDFTAMPLDCKDNGVDIYVPHDRPHGIGYAQLDRL